MAKELSIVPDRTAWTAGETVTGHLTFETRRPARVRSAEARLQVTEFVRASYCNPGDRESHIRTVERALFEGPLVLTPVGGPAFAPGDFPPGSYTWKFEATLPATLPTTFEAPNRDELVALRAAVSTRIAVPWAFDPKTKVSLFVAAPHRPPAPNAFKGGRADRGTENVEAFSLSIAATEVMRGGQFTGMLAYDARGGTHPRGLRVRLIEVATGWAGDAFASVERVLGEVGTASVPESAEPVPFAIRVSAEERITFDAQIISLRHIIEAEADLAQRKNPKMGVHVRII